MIIGVLFTRHLVKLPRIFIRLINLGHFVIYLELRDLNNRG